MQERLRALARALPLAVLGSTIAISTAFAQAAAPMVGMAADGQISLQPAATPVDEAIHSFYNWTNWIIIAIALFVLVLLAVVIIRYNERSNPVPSKMTHHTLLEVAWTIVPIFILVAIAIPSFRLLNFQYSFPKPDLTIKATGYQWYWSHEYPDQGSFTVESYMLHDEDRDALIKQGISAPRQLAVDNEIAVPVNKVVHVLVTGGDVIHSWTIPAFGSKVDAVPGRVMATWFKALREGVFYGQCSELCGKDHSGMPIVIRVVKEDVFNAWAEAWKNKDKDKATSILRAAALEQNNRAVASLDGTRAN